MTAKRFNEADIDFDAIDGELAKLVPPKLSLTDVLDRLRKRLVEQQAKGVTVAQMHEVLKSGGIDITERSLRTFLDKGVLPGRRLPRPPGPWCPKKAVIRSEPNEGACEFAKQGSGVRRTAVRRGGFRDADNEVAMGDGRALAWRFSARIRRWREPPRRKAAMHRSKNEERPASVSSHSWRRREAPRHGP